MVKKKSTKIAVIGGGRIGATVRRLLHRNGCEVKVWDTDASRMPARAGGHAPATLKETAEGAQFVFLCVPSWGLREALRSIKPHMTRRETLVAFTKGIEKGTHKLSYEIIRAECPRNDYAIVGGPFLAEELDRGLHGVGIVGTKKRSVFLKIKKLFEGTPAKFIHSSDVRGVALAGVLKNIYAVGLGIADGVGWGANAKGWLAARLGDEMVRLGMSLGAKEKTMRGAALGDLIASGFSPYSQNRRTGEEILKWKARTIASESVASYPSLVRIVGKRMPRYPYLTELSRVVLKRKDPRVVFKKFLER